MSNYVAPMVVIAIGALCSLFGSFWLTRVQAQERQRSSEARAAFEGELREKSDQIASLNQTIASSVTGGDSWCYLLPLRPDSSVNGVKIREGTGFDLMLMHEGAFPLYDVDVRVRDGNLAGQIVRAAHERGELPYGSLTEAHAKLGASEAAIRIGNVAPKTAVTVGPVRFSDGNSQVFQISIVARNGALSETIRWERVDGDWKLAFRVLREQEVLKDEWDKDFPLGDGKTTPW